MASAACLCPRVGCLVAIAVSVLGRCSEIALSASATLCSVEYAPIDDIDASFGSGLVLEAQ